METKTRETLAEKLLKLDNAPKYAASPILDTVTIAVRVPKGHERALKHNLNGGDIWYAPLSVVVEKYLVDNQATLFAPISADYSAELESAEKEVAVATQVLETIKTMAGDNPAMVSMVKNAEETLASALAKVAEVKQNALAKKSEELVIKKAKAAYEAAKKLSNEQYKLIYGTDKPVEEKSEEKSEERSEKKLEKNEFDD